jgi:hypothetical protein
MEQGASYMNKVDLLIKQMMLQYPSIYPTRLSCLRHLFLVNGNGYDWDEAGCLVPWRMEYDRANDQMYYTDLDREEKDELFDSVISQSGLKDNPLVAFHKLEKDKERLDRQFREQHIDLFCQCHGIYDDFKYEDLVNFDVRYSAFNSAPYGHIDSDWLAAMEETVSKMFYTFNQVWGMHYDTPLKGDKMPEPSMFSRMPDRWQQIYRSIQKIENKLEAQSKTRERSKEFWDSIKDDFLKKCISD